ncbi:MAG: porin [Gammaproteobacteria bacterium]
MYKRLLVPVTIASLLAPAAAMAEGISVYGSVRTQLEYVDPDNLAGQYDEYFGLRDAYSRVGVKFDHAINDDWSFLAKLELPVDTANVAIQDPYGHGTHERVYSLSVSSPYGTVWVGQDWMPFYNAITYPIDYFSSYYSGFATFTGFRMSDTLGYYSPKFNGFSFAGAHSKHNGYGGSDDRTQFTVSWAGDNGFGINGGVDNARGATDAKIYGLSATYTTGNWYLAAKHEWFDSNQTAAGFGQDDSNATNFLVQYTMGKNTFRGMVAQSDFFGESVLHVGWDHQYTDNLKVFAEAYYEEETAAISDARGTAQGGHVDSSPANSGGTAIMTGVRYDFSL